MIEAAVAQRYARALLSIAQDEKALKEVGGDMGAALAMLEASPELSQLLANPMVAAPERSQVMLQIAEKAGFHKLTRSFLRLLGDKGRLDYLAAIAQAFARLADEQLGRLRAEVRATAPLLPDELEQIRQALAQRTGKEIVVDSHIDPDLLGGVVARVGDKVYDSSVRSHLARLKQSILEA